MPSKNDRSFCFSGLAIVFCFLIWVLGCTGFSVYRKSSSCTLVNVYCISMKSFTHMHTLVPTISKTKTKTKTYQLAQKGSHCDCQACVKCVESISSHSPLPLCPLEAERHDGREQWSKSQTAWAWILASILLALWSCVSGLISPYLSFLTCKMAITVLPSWGCCEEYRSSSCV